MKQQAPGAGPRHVQTAKLVDFCSYRCRRSHDRALKHLALRLDFVSDEAREPLHHCLEAAGVFIELLLHPPAGEPLVSGVPPERLDQRHFLRLYALLTSRHIDLLHTDLLGELAASPSDLQSALRQLFGTQLPLGCDLIEELEELLDIRIPAPRRERVRTTINHLYASTLTALSG